MTDAVTCLSQDFQSSVFENSFLRLWNGFSGFTWWESCAVLNYTLKKTRYCYGKFCSCASQILPSLSMWIFLQRWKPEELFGYPDTKYEDCLLGSSLSFFKDTFCRVMAYKQLKWKTIGRDYEFIKKKEKNKQKIQHSSICRRRGQKPQLVLYSPK